MLELIFILILYGGLSGGLAFRLYDGGAPPKRLLPSRKTMLPPPLKLKRNERKNNRNNSLLSLTPPKIFFLAESQALAFEGELHRSTSIIRPFVLYKND